MHPLKAARSGSALVAPRVSVPAHLQAVGGGAARGGALGALAKGRHVHVPGVRKAVRAEARAQKKAKGRR
jgi:hypothetical protein